MSQQTSGVARETKVRLETYHPVPVLLPAHFHGLPPPCSPR
ncbi:mCG1030758 [Mus musculus]|nr:mCG1030758 [Mus musculus]